MIAYVWEKVKDALKSGAHNFIDHEDATAKPLFENKVIHLVSNRSWWTSDAGQHPHHLQRQHQPYLVVGNMGWTEVLDGSRAVNSAYALDDGGYGTLVVGRHQVVK